MDIQLHYIEQGTGMPLILLHGNGENHTYFQHQIDCFSKKYRVIAIDTRGHGDSPRGTAPFTIEQFADDLYHFMEAKSIAKAHILGFSDGGNIGLVFALQHPERVGKLILNGANLFPKGMKTSVYWWVLRHYWKAKWQNDKAQQEMMALMLRQPHIAPESLAAVTAQTLIVVGNKDMIRERHTRLIHSHIKGSQLIIIEGSHFCASENHGTFNRLVGNFLEK